MDAEGFEPPTRSVLTRCSGQAELGVRELEMRDSNPRSVSPHPVYSRDPLPLGSISNVSRRPRIGGPGPLHPHHPREPRAAFCMTVPLAYAGWCVPGAHRAHRSSPPADLGVKVHSDKESLSSSQRSSASNPWGRSEVDGPLPVTTRDSLVREGRSDPAPSAGPSGGRSVRCRGQAAIFASG